MLRRFTEVFFSELRMALNKKNLTFVKLFVSPPERFYDFTGRTIASKIMNAIRLR
jgi:hypothetical protein